MRVLVCGGRNFSDASLVRHALGRIHLKTPITALISGCAPGADTLAEEWAADAHVPIEGYPADWEGQGRKAGPIRNQRMLDEASPDLVVAFPGGRGTDDMMRRAFKAGVRRLIVDAADT